MAIFQADIPDELLMDRYAPPPSKFCRVGQMNVHYRDQGPEAAEPVLLLHGSQSSLHTFEPWVRLVAGKFRLVSLDLPGHGLTSPMPSDDYSYPALVEFLHKFMRGLGIEKFAVAGNSWGGLIAIYYAVLREQELTRLILLDCAGYPYPDPLSCRIGRIPGLAQLFTVMTPPGLIREELCSTYFDKSLVTDELFTRYYELMLRQGNRRAQILINKPRNAYHAAPEILNRLKEISIPALVMWGKADPWLPLSLGQRYASEISNAELKVYQRCGHLPMEEVPEESARDLLTFMSRTGSRPSDSAVSGAHENES